MAISIVPVISEPVYLQDLSGEVKQVEGADCARSEQVFIIARQATEADVRVCYGLVSKREITVLIDGARTETWDDDASDLRAMQIYTTLVDVGNLSDKDGKPLFEFRRGPDYHQLDMEFSAFKKLFGLLPMYLVHALVWAIWEANPQWDLRSFERLICPHCEGEINPQAAERVQNQGEV